MGGTGCCIFHKMMVVISVFLSSVDLGIGGLGKIKIKSLVQKNACCRQANLFVTQPVWISTKSQEDVGRMVSLCLS